MWWTSFRKRVAAVLAAALVAATSTPEVSNMLGDPALLQWLVKNVPADLKAVVILAAPVVLAMFRNMLRKHDPVPPSPEAVIAKVQGDRQGNL